MFLCSFNPLHEPHFPHDFLSIKSTLATTGQLGAIVCFFSEKPKKSVPTEFIADTSRSHCFDAN
jgi:hypothetical protein